MAWAPDYVTVEDVKDWLQITDANDDGDLAVWCTTASRAIDARCNRQFGIVDAPIDFYADGPAYYVTELGRWFVDIPDLMTTTALTVGGTAYGAQTAAVLWPRDAPLKGRPWTALSYLSRPTVPDAGIALFGSPGWSAVPAQVGGAARLQVSRFHARRASPLGVAGSPSEGSEMRLLARLDPDVAVALAGLSRPRRMG